MELILKPKDFVHNKEKSTYNHNYYTCISSNINVDTEIFEHCDENYETYDFSFIQKGVKIFLGSGYDSLG